MKIFEPIKVGAMVVKNRLALAPMDTELSGFCGEVTDKLISYYSERAAGGVGLIIVEFTAVDGEQRLTSPGIFSDRFISGWSRLVEKVHAYGVKIILQIAHHGGRALERVTGVRPVAPSAISSPLYDGIPRELTKEEIEVLIAKFVRAAERAKAAGFDGVEIHGGHGYLIGQFLSPYTNRRGDEHGGAFENRMRFPIEILRRARDRLGRDFVIGFKFSAYECLDGGIDIELAKRIAKHMEEQGIDYLHVSVLSFPLPEARYPSVPPIYTRRPPLVELAAQIKSQVRVPVITVGGFGELEEVQQALESGAADIVALGRALIADPKLPNKWRYGGIPRPCIRCNRCHTRIMEQTTIRCAVNPEAGREGEELPPAPRVKRVAVVGGGPAGVMAAVTAAQRGHTVFLFEERNCLGGKIIAAAKPTFKRPLKQFLNFLEVYVRKSGVKVELGVHATPEVIEVLSPDLVILATGGKEHTLPFETTMGAIAAFEHPDELGKKVLIVGAGMVGCELALFLDELGKDVFLVDKLQEQQLMPDEHYFNRYILLEEVKRSGVEFRPGIEVRVRQGKAELAGEEIDIDSVINATGFEPDEELAARYRESFGDDRILPIGDAKKPGNIYTAVQEAYLVASCL